HGCPAEQAPVDYRTVAPVKHGPLRKTIYSVSQILGALLIAPIAICGAVTALEDTPRLSALLAEGHPALSTITFYLGVAAAAVVVFYGGLLLSLLVMCTVPRLLAPFITPGKVYPLYGLAYMVQSSITALSNSKFFMLLLGDSSFIVTYVKALGYKLGVVEQTGSNFGTEMNHDSPHLTHIGTGTMVSDGLSVMNADYSNTSFRVSHVVVGARNFLGNSISYPAGARLGENCLLATKVMVPIHGPIRENVGLLGSPPFEIPRSSQREPGFEYMDDPAEVARRLKAKNRHNAVGMFKVLLIRLFQFFVTMLLAAVALDLYGEYGMWAIVGAVIPAVIFNVVYPAFVERAVLGFQGLSPQNCSIYDEYFWGHER